MMHKKTQQLSFHPDIERLLNGNAVWREWLRAQGSEFLNNLALVHSPKYLYIGCVDSRVPIEEITGVNPGEILVFRNIANQTIKSDPATESVVQFAVEILRVRHIIICGHSNCGGVGAGRQPLPQFIHLNAQVAHIQALNSQHNQLLLNTLPTEEERIDKLSEINAFQNAFNLTGFQPVRQAWNSNQQLSIHVWFYTVNTGKINDLQLSFSSHAEALQRFESYNNSLRP